MQVKWILTPRDPLWIACMRARYERTAHRYASGNTGLRDADRLSVALSALELSRDDFDRDVNAIREGHEHPRTRGEWPEDPGIHVEEIHPDTDEAVEYEGR